MKPMEIALTKNESKVYATVLTAEPIEDFDGDWKEVADSMELLAKSLFERRAIPEIRLKVFCDPLYAERGKKSQKEIFQSNGTSGDDVLRHPDFVDVLRYFIEGPRLPLQVMQEFQRLVEKDHGTSGMQLNERARYAREQVRRFRLDQSEAGTEFFKLCLEVGLRPSDARLVRESVKSVRRN